MLSFKWNSRVTNHLGDRAMVVSTEPVDAPRVCFLTAHHQERPAPGGQKVIVNISLHNPNFYKRSFCRISIPQ